MNTADVSEVRALAASLDDATRKVQGDAYPTAVRAGVQMQKDWRQRWSGMKALPALGSAVTFDVRLVGLRAVEVEVGPDKTRKQGALGNIAEFGSSQHPPLRPAGAQVLKTEAENVARLLAELGKQAL